MEIFEVVIKNFKSIKKQKLDLSKNIVLIGPNASGKTNILEFFKFMKTALTSFSLPFNPVADWWGYQNIVYEKNISNNIEGAFRFKLEDFLISYAVSFGMDPLGQLTIIHEELLVSDVYKFERSNKMFTFSYDLAFLEKVSKQMPFEETLVYSFKDEDLNALKEKITIKIERNGQHIPLFNLIGSWSGSYSTDFAFVNIDMLDINKSRQTFVFPFISGNIKEQANLHFGLGPLFSAVNFELSEFFRQITILKHPDLKTIRQPLLPTRQVILREDGSNLNEILYQWFIKNKRFPALIEETIRREFSNSSISFDITLDGRILLLVDEDGLELQPHSISDGFYKLLFVLTAYETKPSLLLIDEIENSLHKKLIEFIVDTINLGEIKSILTTHSPVIVDMINLNQLRIVSKQFRDTIIEKTMNIKNLKIKLHDLGLAQSDAWFEGILSGKS